MHWFEQPFFAIMNCPSTFFDIYFEILLEAYITYVVQYVSSFLFFS